MSHAPSVPVAMVKPHRNIVPALAVFMIVLAMKLRCTMRLIVLPPPPRSPEDNPNLVSAFNLFVEEHGSKIKKTLNAKGQTSKRHFKKECVRKWKTTNEETKYQYKKLARQLRKQITNGQLAQIAENGGELLAPKQKVRRASKGPSTPYFLWKSENLEAIRAKFPPDTSGNFLATVCGALWRNLPAEDRLRYSEKFRIYSEGPLPNKTENGENVLKSLPMADRSKEKVDTADDFQGSLEPASAP